MNLSQSSSRLVEITQRVWDRCGRRGRVLTQFGAAATLLVACYGPEPLPAFTQRTTHGPERDASRESSANASADASPPSPMDASQLPSPTDAPPASEAGDGREGALADAALPVPVPFDGPSTAQPGAERLVAMGDLHSDIGSTRAAFRLAGAINAQDEWIGGDLTIVQLGDVIGRSDDEREVLEFLFDIRKKAVAGGGAVHVLLGNHEVMGGRVDFQAVGHNPFPGWEDLTDLDVDDPRLQFLPEFQRKRGAALMAGGLYAKKLAESPTVLRVGDTIYVHGGVVPRWAVYGLDRINWEVSQWLRGETAEPDVSTGVDNTDKVMWTRVFSTGEDATRCALLDETLKILGAKRMIVAHTVQPTITPRCNEKVWAVDVGMSRAYGGPIEVLEIVEDEALSVLRE